MKVEVLVGMATAFLAFLRLIALISVVPLATLQAKMTFMPVVPVWDREVRGFVKHGWEGVKKEFEMSMMEGRDVSVLGLGLSRRRTRGK